MADRIFDSSWVDRYVRNALPEDDALEFEAAMFDSAALRRDVEVALSLQSALCLDNASSESTKSDMNKIAQRVRPWSSLAMAASVLVGVIGTAMWFKSNSEIAELQGQVAELSRSYDQVVIQRLDLLRSGGAARESIPKPIGNALLVLDIEMSRKTRDLDQVHVSAVGEDGRIVSSWSGSGTDRVSLGIRSGQLREGPLTIEFIDGNGVKLEKRRLDIVATR